VQALLNDIFGMGPIEVLMRLPDVEDIAINGPCDIWFKRRGYWEKSDIEYPDPQALLVTLNRAIVHTNRQAGPLTPIVDATLRSGHRINIVTQPLATPWPVASIRIHRDRTLLMEDLVVMGGEDRAAPQPRLLPDYFERDSGRGTVAPLAATFLHMAVLAGFNILVVGPTGVGKTTVLGALGRLIPADRRILVIEDTRELRIRGMANSANCIYLVTRPPSLEGGTAITQRDLVIAALRQRPDALTVGEARGPEVFDMLKALWTGHRNGLTSIHADAIGDVPNRIAMMLQEANFQTEVSEATIAHWIARAFHLGLSLRRIETGRRYVDEIVEFTGGVEGTVPVTTPLFRYATGRQRLLCTGFRLDPEHEAQLLAVGYRYDLILDAAHERKEMA
jgi:pilus assembly protein CpaF